MGHRVYEGASARARRESIVYACPCGERFRAEVYRAVDGGSPEAVASLLEGRLNRVTCPACAAQADVQVPVVYHDTATPRMVLVLPDGLRHRELEERARFFEALAADREPPAAYVLAAEVAFGAAGLRALLAGPEPGAPQVTPAPLEPERTRVIEVAQLNEREKARGKGKEKERQKEKAPHAPVEAAEPARARMAVPDPRTAMTERWIAGREGPQAFLVEDRVLVCASLGPRELEAFVATAEPLELRVQLHRMPTYPIVALTFIVTPLTDGAPRAASDQVLTVPLDVARAAHRVVLDALGRSCALMVELYDSQYLPVVSHEVKAPLEENVRRLAADAKDALDRLAPQGRSYERARAMLMQSTYDRIGRTPVELPDPDQQPLETPGAVLQALAAIARWSEPSAEAYLVEIRALPLVRWRSLRARIVRAALDAGIAVPRPLVERSAKEYASPLPSWQELLAIQIKRFAEVSSRVRPNDLSAQEEAENWDLLLRECALAGVLVDDRIRQLAADSVKRARAAAGGGVDLRTLATSELVALLEPKELRREAAVVLCERRETPTLPALFSAIRRMPRAEANLVLPAVVAFGPPVENWLIEGLKSKKAFMRQGCALALGALKTPLGVDALVRLLLFEPTEIWSEVARALGDVGAQAVMLLAARLRETDPERRERIVQALAHVGARSDAAQAPIEMLAASRDPVVAQAAKRALALVPETRAAHERVRRGKTSAQGHEQTVVRSFSRRFYEALERGVPYSGAIELDPAELEEVAGDSLADEPDHEMMAPAGLPALRQEVPTEPTPRTSLPRGGG